MDMFIAVVVSLVVGVIVGGYLGYRYGKTVQVEARAAFDEIKAKV